MRYYINEQLKNADNENFQELLIPQIDFILNVAQEHLIKMVAFPLYNPLPQFELTHRIKSILQPIVINSKTVDTNVVKYDNTSYLYKIPNDCFIFLGGVAISNNGSCQKEIELFGIEHDTVSSKDYTIKSSFLWEECNYLQINDGIKLEATDFQITGVKPVYIRKSKYMYDADSYKLPYKSLKTGEILTGRQDSELPDMCRLDIANIAVLLIKSMYNSSLDSQLLKIRDIN